ALVSFDDVRLDHFRGFAEYWSVPAAAQTAKAGQWEPGPGAALFEALERKLGRLPLIAEDLGVITPEVEELRDRFGLPGMKILQFAFGEDPTNAFLPHNYLANGVVYTGTHDNDTTAGWYAGLGAKDRDHLAAYLGGTIEEPAWALIRLALASVAAGAVLPLQDVLSIGSEGRMNLPGRASGNWAWRFGTDALTQELAERLADLTRTYGRYR
ncbi:MAG: 4-alpha-glucanotransferase, partial [Cyanobacteria bacterium REEB65]|nr:4-alpha-glucanotransferase [Cyanobacteria bacterium REEB65]